MFINFWYTAGLSSDVGDAPVRRRMLGQDFVLFRDTGGKVHCLADTCVHRGASLGLGKVKGDCIQCPYHGWQFGGDGACRKIPSLGAKAKIPGRARVDSYPTVEKYGLIFAFLGDIPEAERCPILPIPEYGPDGPLPGWASTVLPTYFLGGVQLFSIGIIGEYLGKVYLEVKHRPRFIVEETC